MDNTRIEILKEGTWIFLELGKGESIRYNSVINKIGKTSTREISGSNTFSIPWTYHNVQTLGLNQFNAIELASSLNQKYEAKYYNEDTLFQVGFVIINNMDNGLININFIDEALFITEKWGATSYHDLLKDVTLSAPAAYITAIAEMTNYNANKLAVLPHLTNLSGETFPIALFPNNLNQIGDKWQIYGDGSDHIDNGINPYQSRPIFNAKAFITLACRAFGYAPVFHTSINWATVAKTYMVTEGLNKSQYGSGGLTTLPYYFPTATISVSHWKDGPFNAGQTYDSQVAMKFAGSNSISPVNLVGSYYSSSDWPGVKRQSVNTITSNFLYNQTVYVPETSSGNVGTIRFTASTNHTYTEQIYGGVYIVYKHLTNVNGFVYELATEIDNSSNGSTVDITIDKAQFDSITIANKGEVQGLYVLAYKSNTNQFNGENMNLMDVAETYSPPGLISYDEHGQYLQDAVDLTHAASQDKISSLLKGLMQKEGMLMNIDSKNKEIEFFAYSAYATRRDAGESSDWSKYLLEYSNPKFNTNYGNDYGISNSVGLKDPYPGNSIKIILGNQTTSSSKYKDSAEDYNSKFKDVTSAQKMLYTITPYTEFTVEGDSLVELDVALGNLSQYRYDNSTTSIGTLTNLPSIYNVNFAVAPSGVSDWYNLIDNSVRVTPSFLLPLDEIKDLDLRKPIFVSQLGGYFIPEEVEQYVDSVTPVSVKLIKLNFE